MKSILYLLFTFFFAPTLIFAQEEDYLCPKLTEDQGFAGFAINTPVKSIPDIAKRLTIPTTSLACFQCLNDDIEAYSVKPQDLNLDTIYGLGVDRIELFYEPYYERDSLDILYVAEYDLLGIVVQLNLPENQELLDDFQTGLFNDYFPVLDSYAITKRGERLQWLGDGGCGVLMSIDMSFRLKHYEERGFKTIEWVFASGCGD